MLVKGVPVLSSEVAQVAEILLHGGQGHVYFMSTYGLVTQGARVSVATGLTPVILQYLISLIRLSIRGSDKKVLIFKSQTTFSCQWKFPWKVTTTGGTYYGWTLICHKNYDQILANDSFIINELRPLTYCSTSNQVGKSIPEVPNQVRGLLPNKTVK